MVEYLPHIAVGAIILVALFIFLRRDGGSRRVGGGDRPSPRSTRSTRPARAERRAAPERAAGPRVDRASDLPESVLEEIAGQIRAGRKIEAIKLMREATGLGLKEAKEAVEDLERAL